ncbi:MAG TPA: TadE/TadG family type IV pilus assembly protein [Bryobacteraceae bacterium]|nr:TadE/TadG family type IV pilus assembly protein [Bryobacteraceae bacterium]
MIRFSRYSFRVEKLYSKIAGRRSRQRGNVMIESVLTFIPTLAMFLGIVDVSLVIFLQSTLTNATLEGVRWAITYQSTYNGTSCASSQAACVAQVVENNCYGFLSSTQTNLVTVNYYTANNLGTPVETCNGGTCTQTGTLPQTLSNGTVVSYANQPGNVVQVVVAGYPWNWLFPVSASGYHLTASSINLGATSMDVLGGLAVGTTVPPNP